MPVTGLKYINQTFVINNTRNLPNSSLKYFMIFYLLVIKSLNDKKMFRLTVNTAMSQKILHLCFINVIEFWIFEKE